MSDIDPEKLEADIAALEKWVARFSCFHDVSVESFDRTFDAARAHLATLPKIKEVEVWRTEYATNGVPSILSWYTREAADAWADGAKSLDYIDCIRVTGPHKQRVPA